jgi:hypothetical protein
LGKPPKTPPHIIRFEGIHRQINHMQSPYRAERWID